MPQLTESMIREGYAAFGRGDLDGFLAICTADFTFNVPGNNAQTGTYRGRQGMLELVGKVMPMTAGQFQEEVHDVLVNGTHAVVLALHRFPRNGVPKEYRTAHVYEIRDGKLAECWEQPQDPLAFDDAWAPNP